MSYYGVTRINGVPLHLCSDGVIIKPEITEIYTAEQIGTVVAIAARLLVEVIDPINRYQSAGYVGVEPHEQVVGRWDNLLKQYPNIEVDTETRKLLRESRNIYEGYKQTQRRLGTATDKTRRGYVYLIQSQTGSYKIGRTKNPSDRMKTFSVKLPFEVEYVTVIQTDDMYALEAALHRRFLNKRVNGEWFALTADDVEYIKGLAQS